ncbi:sorting nexin-8-like isoform X3 [Gadus macrocephalus]|uniref:sorting nexin-8-like isoform X3 n=1 Tax=Gadus macrocephalus TaxID=80720 RepID=UPI0028CB39FC|nr:sorting nexin-8-like isoform X3 [Gadus macrocephalus]
MYSRSSEQGPLMDSPTSPSLLNRHSVKVDLMPEKKGLPFLKHVQYEITTKRYRLPVHRSYNDFDVFRTLLIQRFPYRMVSQLPPKRMLKGVLSSQSEEDFIECRRRGLERFIALIMQHPFMSKDAMVDIFLCASAEDVKKKLRESFKNLGDEFLTNWSACQAKDYLPSDVEDQVASCREFIGNIESSFQHLRDKMERMTQRSNEHATDLQLFSHELGMLGHCLGPKQEHVQRVWSTQRQCLRRMSKEFTTLVTKAEQKQESLKEMDVLDILNMFVDLLHAYKELWDRHEHSMFIEHQKALLQNSTSNLRHGATTASSLAFSDILGVQQLESNLTKQENAIVTMELRNDFSLLCLYQETQLFLGHLPLVTQILAGFIRTQGQVHAEMGALWSELGFKLTSLREPSCSPDPEPDEILSPSSSSELCSVSLASSSGFLVPSIHGDPSINPSRPSSCPSTQVKQIPHPSPQNRPQHR